ncbi:predicted protein [Pyrenophora tritici-repentis Pt-1C-BFP]|uniref:Uncharacterized protein n=1 Tax=Pyrenophora tritici-repentis (strain Pt-1C-BFP) TaxID=426418 RepID=B2W777_PYRTR|nr:uncharacterized protein PTRG_05665 [Pyrenophora tritici-repentis Pt-1C-BFP]EDU48585.1 predicted protein [Pyrenophora tritici-repentis Pt-1C-BFP]
MFKLGGQPCGSPDPWYLGKTKAFLNLSVSCRAASLGQEPTGTLTCVGTGANKTWESLLAHGRGLAQGGPEQKTKPKIKDNPFPLCPSSPFVKANRRY